MSTFCLVGEVCPLAWACVHHINTARTTARERVEAKLITPKGEWTTSACSEFEKAENSQMHVRKRNKQ
jgi:hypothetical protein